MQRFNLLIYNYQERDTLMQTVEGSIVGVTKSRDEMNPLTVVIKTKDKVETLTCVTLLEDKV